MPIFSSPSTDQPTMQARVVVQLRKLIGLLATLNFALLTLGYAFSFADLWDYNDDFMVLQQIILNMLMALAAIYTFWGPRTWPIKRRLLGAIVLSILMLMYGTSAAVRIKNMQGGCPAYGRLEHACWTLVVVVSMEWVVVAFVGIEGFLTMKLRGKEEEKELQRMLDLQELQALPPVVVHYTPELALVPSHGDHFNNNNNSNNHQTAVLLDTPHSDPLPAYERQLPPGRPFHIVDMGHPQHLHLYEPPSGPPPPPAGSPPPPASGSLPQVPLPSYTP